MVRLATLLFLLLASTVTAAMPPCTVGHIRPDSEEDSRDAYFIQLLELALRQTELDFGLCRLETASVRMSQSRAMASMLEGRYVDVIWTMTSPEREATMMPVRVPLLKGLMGIRIPVASTHAPPQGLAASRDAEALSAYTIAQGHDWPDTRILRANGLRVSTTPSYDALFRMLAHGRVDHVPRSVTEVWAEQSLYRRHGLAPLEAPIIAYHAPSYFFVAPDNLRLALRLEVGLRRALEDGSFHALFEAHPANRSALEILRRAGSQVIWLENPVLPEDTPVDDTELWYQPLFGDTPR